MRNHDFTNTMRWGLVRMRRVPLWVCGLFFAAYFGALLGQNLAPDYSKGGTFGMIGAMIAFASTRLWLPAQEGPS